MRNLKVIYDSTRIESSELPLSACAWDTSRDSIIYTLGPCTSTPCIELRRWSPGYGEDPSMIASWDAPCPLPDLDADKILSLQYLADRSVSCLVLAGGDIVQVLDEAGLDQAKVEVVGSVEEGITAASWSPDGELLVLSTRAGTFLFMTVDFENTASVTFRAEDASLSKHVSVGWGKAETQFKGKGAKALRDPTVPEKTDQGVLSEHDQGDVNISWRGDGAYVAVNGIIDSGPRRMIRIYSRDGILDSVTEPVDGLEGALSWRPAGNLIAGLQRLESQVNVIFFERNGLRHGQFSLRLTAEDSGTWASSTSLAWSVDSSALAVSFRDRLQIWTMGNYHYYLKQEISYRASNENTIYHAIIWHPEEPLRFSAVEAARIVTDVNGHMDTPSKEPSFQNSLKSTKFIYAVSIGPTELPNDLGTAVVIDGNAIKITPLRKANVPPPMALYEIDLQLPVKDVSISVSNSAVAALQEGLVSLIRFGEDGFQSPPVIAQNISVPQIDGHVASQVCFKADELFILFRNASTKQSLLYDVSSSRYYSLTTSSFIRRLLSSINHESLCFLEDSRVFSVVLPQPQTEVDIPVPLHEVLICDLVSNPPWSMVEVVYRNGMGIAFGLTENGALYANNRVLVKNCTSFLLTLSHLIFTTANHLLKFVHITSVPDLEIPPDEPETDERCRNIERGARLVTVMPSTFSLTLQMPRGNLETIYPRALVLSSIRRSIEAKSYGKAFRVCRSQRVDLNILYDYSPKQFLFNVDLIVHQLKKVEYIDLFLSQLRGEDVSQTMYRETLQRPGVGNVSEDAVPAEENYDHSHAKSGDLKVNRICDAFLAVLERHYETNVQNVVTALVCKIPPDIEAGLRVVATLRDNQTNLSDSAVEHICFLADANKVYDIALGTYNLELALLVAQQSQKDPREYLPYMQDLESLPKLRMQFKIDDDLGRYTKALGHLHAMKAFDELQGYVQKHELYRDALQLYRYEADALSVLMRLHADFLESRNRFKEAAMTYESLSDQRSACDAYRAAGLWQECLSTAMAVPLPLNELRSLAQSLADGLAESKDFQAAAIIHLDYLSDIENGIRLLCKGNYFAAAIRTAGVHNLRDLISEIVDPSLVEASASLTELLADCKSQLAAQVPRIRELRKIKSHDPLAFLEGGGGDEDVPDDISLAPSETSTTAGASLFTRYTNRTDGTLATGTSRKTSKNRRREERKRARGKKGSAYEEEYLVGSVGRLIERVNSTCTDVEVTVMALVRRNMLERARAVDAAMVEVVASCKVSVKQVFEDGLDKTTRNETDQYGTLRPPGGEGVLWESQEEAKARRETPMVKEYQPSPLL